MEDRMAASSTSPDAYLCLFCKYKVATFFCCYELILFFATHTHANGEKILFRQLAFQLYISAFHLLGNKLFSISGFF